MNICIYIFSNEMTLPTAISIYLVIEKKSQTLNFSLFYHNFYLILSAFLFTFPLVYPVYLLHLVCSSPDAD